MIATKNGNAKDCVGSLNCDTDSSALEGTERW